MRGATAFAVGSDLGRFAVEARDAATGVVHWTDTVAGAVGFTDLAREAAGAGHTVAVVGTLTTAADMGLGRPAHADFVVRAYEPGTGALRWQDRFDGSTPSGVVNDLGTAVAAGLRGVVAVGLSGNRGIVRAYHRTTGALLWQDTFAGPGGSLVLDVTDVAIRGVDVVVTGVTGSSYTDSDGIVRGYDMRTGALRWQDVFGAASGQEQARAVALGRGRAAIVGTVANPMTDHDLAVRVHDVRTGALQWAAEWDGSGLFDAGTAVAVDRNRVLAVGSTTVIAGIPDVSGGDVDGVVRAYDLRDGRLLWADRADPGPAFVALAAVAATGGVAVATGAAFDSFTGVALPWTRAYDARTGGLLWENLATTPAPFSNLAIGLTHGTAVVVRPGGAQGFALR